MCINICLLVCTSFPQFEGNSFSSAFIKMSSNYNFRSGVKLQQAGKTLPASILDNLQVILTSKDCFFQGWAAGVGAGCFLLLGAGAA